MTARGKKREAASSGTPKATPSGRGTKTGVAGKPGRPTTRGPAAGIGSPIYDELVDELGDPAA